MAVLLEWDVEELIGGGAGVLPNIWQWVFLPKMNSTKHGQPGFGAAAFDPYPDVTNP